MKLQQTVIEILAASRQTEHALQSQEKPFIAGLAFQGKEQAELHNTTTVLPRSKNVTTAILSATTHPKTELIQLKDHF